MPESEGHGIQGSSIAEAIDILDLIYLNENMSIKKISIESRFNLC